MEIAMKLLIATVALATALALPAIAETVGDPAQDNQTSNAIQNDQQMQKPALGAKAKASSGTVGSAASDKNNLAAKPAGKIKNDDLDSSGGTGGNSK
jgi:hypothetical protein